jgi:hypothetical protein
VRAPRRLLSRLLGLAERLLFALCLAAVAAALVIVPYDRSGALRRELERRATDRLAPAGGSLTLERARLHWSDPGLRLSGVRVVDGEGRELLAAEQLRIQFGLLPPRIERIEVSDAAVHLSRRSFEWLERLAAGEGEPSGRGSRAPRNRDRTLAERQRGLPELRLRRVSLDGDTVQALPFDPPLRGPLGQLDLAVRRRASGALFVDGTFVPRLFGPRDLADVRFSGDMGEDGSLLVATQTLGLRLDSDDLPAPVRSAATRFGPWRATLDLEASARLGPDLWPPLEADARAAVHDFTALLEDPQLAPEAVELALEGRYRREAATGRSLGLGCDLSGTWRGAAVELVGRAGGLAPERAEWLARSRVTALPVDGVTLGEVQRLLRDQLGLANTARILDNTFTALGVAGRTDLWATVEAPRRAPDGSLPPPRVAAVFDPTRGTTMEFQGWPSDGGGRAGFPFPVEVIEGRVVVSADPAHDLVTLVGLSELAGSHGGRRIECDGVIATPPTDSVELGPDGERHSDLRLSLRVPELATDDEVRAGLRGLDIGFDIERAFAPRGGTVSGRIEIEQRPSMPYPLLSLDLALRGLSARWEELPVEVSELEGELALRWSGDVVGVRRADGSWPEPAERDFRRAFGLGARLVGREPEGAAVRVELGLRDPELEWLDGPQRHPPDTFSHLRNLRVALEPLALDGPTVAELGADRPSLLAGLRTVGATGRVEASLESAVASREGPARTALSFRPVELGLTVAEVPLSQVRGHGQWVRAESPVEGAAETRAEIALQLGTELPDATRGAASFRGPVGERGAAPGDLRLWLGAVNPLADEWRPLLDGQGWTEAADELRAVQPRGRLDGELQLELDGNLEPAAPPRLAVQFRRLACDLGPLPVRELDGSVTVDGSAGAYAERLSLEVLGRRLELRELLLLPAAERHRLAPAAAALAARASAGERFPWLFTATFDLDSLELDAQQWAELSAQPADRSWRLSLDASGATILAGLGGEGSPVLALSGPFVPHDLHLSGGLPLRIARAELDLRQAILEEGRLRAVAEIEGAYGDVAGISITDARSVLSFVGGRLTFDGLDGGFSGGRITGQASLGGEALPGVRAASFELAPPYRFDLALAFERLEVEELLRAALGEQGADRGRLRGHLRLVGQPGDPLGLEGSGFLALEEARLWSIPVVRELFEQLGFDASATFDWMRTDLRVRDGQLTMTDSVAHSPLLKLVGGGQLGLDGRLEHDFELTYSLVDRLPLIGALFYWLQGRILRIAVRGDMTRPRVILTNPLLDLLGRTAAEPPRLPYPALRDLPRRF